MNFISPSRENTLSIDFEDNDLTISHFNPVHRQQHTSKVWCELKLPHHRFHFLKIYLHIFYIII